MISVLLIFIPVVSGLISFFLKGGNAAKAWALVSSIITLVIALGSLCSAQHNQLSYDVSWLPGLGAHFSLALDGMGKMLTLLTAISFPVVFIATYKNEYKDAISI